MSELVSEWVSESVSKWILPVYHNHRAKLDLNQFYSKHVKKNNFALKIISVEFKFKD